MNPPSQYCGILKRHGMQLFSRCRLVDGHEKVGNTSDVEWYYRLARNTSEQSGAKQLLQDLNIYEIPRPFHFTELGLLLSWIVCDSTSCA